MTPEPGKTGLVGLPVWLWIDRDATSWSVTPLQKTVKLRGVEVTAYAVATRVDWSMGDGTTVPCYGPGIKYDAKFENNASHECGYRYATTSLGKPDDKFAVTATVNWTATYTVNGGGSIPLRQIVATSDVTNARVGELQVLN
ncbi:ATP/GTP-binding protein [Embleya sp. NBC_00896]|uniref:ATP/GTP-binding protein n=1 Tax=Embleya sp. NBC_00896 TaxID=2975961 RepID=UPI003869A78A|nr:ATP/GTP-binding protein [Embleya sp. NBC_00896]